MPNQPCFTFHDSEKSMKEGRRSCSTSGAPTPSSPLRVEPQQNMPLAALVQPAQLWHSEEKKKKREDEPTTALRHLFISYCKKKNSGNFLSLCINWLSLINHFYLFSHPLPSSKQKCQEKKWSELTNHILPKIQCSILTRQKWEKICTRGKWKYAQEEELSPHQSWAVTFTANCQWQQNNAIRSISQTLTDDFWKRPLQGCDSSSKLTIS